MRYLSLIPVRTLSTILIINVLYLCLGACHPPPPPKHVNNICNIYKEYPKWYFATQKSEKQWHIPLHVQMAIMHQESRFDGQAKPPRRKLLGFIPWLRPTTSYGYTQAKNKTWQQYLDKTGRKGADRDTFRAAADFVGWYANLAHQKLGIPYDDTYNLYLAYHEGIAGYRSESYNLKPWLKQVSRKVEIRGAIYKRQLNVCQNTLPKKHWWQFWL